MRGIADDLVDLAVALAIGLGLGILTTDVIWPLALRAARWILEMR